MRAMTRGSRSSEIESCEWDGASEGENAEEEYKRISSSRVLAEVACVQSIYEGDGFRKVI